MTTERSKLLIISGPSGGGKTILELALLKLFPRSRLITITTRDQRNGEPDNAYYFLTMEEMGRCDDLLWDVCLFGTHHYGLTKTEVNRVLDQAEGFAFVNITTTEGQHDILQREFGPRGVKIIPIYLESPGDAELRRRMNERGDNPEEIERRISASHEAEHAAREIDNLHWIPVGTPAETLGRVLELVS